MVFCLMDESGTLEGRVFPSSNQKQIVVSPFFFQAQSDKPSSLCVSQVEVSWSPSLSAYFPCSWWLSSASTSECSAIFVFTFPWRRLFMVDACKDYGNLSANVWFNPITPGRHIPNLPLWNMFVDIDTEMEKKKKKNWKWTKTSLIYPQTASLEECQRSSVNFLNMPYINDRTYLSQKSLF